MDRDTVGRRAAGVARLGDRGRRVRRHHLLRSEVAAPPKGWVAERATGEQAPAAISVLNPAPLQRMHVLGQQIGRKLSDEITHQWLLQCEQRPIDLQAALDTQDETTLSRQAHQLKGSAATVGGTALAALAGSSRTAPAGRSEASCCIRSGAPRTPPAQRSWTTCAHCSVSDPQPSPHRRRSRSTPSGHPLDVRFSAWTTWVPVATWRSPPRTAARGSLRVRASARRFAIPCVGQQPQPEDPVGADLAAKTVSGAGTALYQPRTTPMSARFSPTYMVGNATPSTSDPKGCSPAVPPPRRGAPPRAPPQARTRPQPPRRPAGRGLRSSLEPLAEVACLLLMGDVTFLTQKQPVDEYGRALYAVGRSVIRALLDSLSQQDLVDLNVDRIDVTYRQLAHYARLERDKGMRGDGFEWAVHEAITGGEPRVTEPVARALSRISPKFKGAEMTSSLMFGYERAKYLGFLDAVVQDAGEDAVLLPDGQGRPFKFQSDWLIHAARGEAAEPLLGHRIRKVWKSDLFISDQHARRYTAATVKSNHALLQGGPGLRLGIVPAATTLAAGTRYDSTRGLWLAVLPDPDGFMGLYNDAYWAVAQSIYTVGKHERPPYYMKPSVKGLLMSEQLEKYPTAKVSDIEDALNEAAQQGLVTVEHELVSVEAPEWLHINELRTKVIAPRPSFVPLD